MPEKTKGTKQKKTASSEATASKSTKNVVTTVKKTTTTKKAKVKDPEPVEEVEVDEEHVEGEENKTVRSVPKKYRFEDEDIDTINEMFVEKMKQVDVAMQTLLDVKHFLRDSQSKFVKYRKASDKVIEKQEKRKQTTRIAPKYEVSDELLEFMDLEEGTEVARTEAVSAITKYIKEQELNTGYMVTDKDGNEKQDRRYWQADDKLSKLFPEAQGYVHFNSVMTYLTAHFPKKDEK